MKVIDFANQLGIASTKICYYDQRGLIQGEREGNNYRNFTKEDALNIYHAQMLRSFDMSVQQSINAKDEELSQINDWVNDHAKELETYIHYEEMKLTRLKEMQDYFAMFQKAPKTLTETMLDEQLVVWNFGKVDPLHAQQKKSIRMLAEVMPFSYVSIKISKESLEENKEPLDVSVGLGILRHNQKKLNLELPAYEIIPQAHIYQLFFETPDPFQLTRKEIEPLIEASLKDGQSICEITGRIYFSYMRDGKFVHGVGLGIPVKK